MSSIVGIDPGISGALVWTDGEAVLEVHLMPVEKVERETRVIFDELNALLRRKIGRPYVFLEKPVSFGMGGKQAFSYGRGFEALTIALELNQYPVTLVEPSKWAKVMHEGISADLKPKAKSLIAVRRLYPRLVKRLPTRPKGGLMDGAVDALLIAGYGLRQLGKGTHRNHDDFF